MRDGQQYYTIPMLKWPANRHSADTSLTHADTSLTLADTCRHLLTLTDT